METNGKMDARVVGGLINSIARLSHLVACQNMKNILLKDFRTIVDMLKFLKPMIDEALDAGMPLNDQLMKSCEELDSAVNEAREFLERHSLKMSKICSVFLTESMLLKVQKFALSLCQVLSKLLELSLHSASIERCLQELQCAQQALTSELIEDALREQKQNVMPNLEVIIKLMEKLGLNSNHELFIESVALEKESMRAELKRSPEEVDHINQVIALITHIRYCSEKLQQFGFLNGILIPSHFRCPLSLKLMIDPVIVASGQSYERTFIQKWIDNGLIVCPKTRQTLSHTNLTPNYTVKALISNWCEENNIHHSDSAQSGRISNPFLGSITVEDFNHQDGFHDPVWRGSVSGSSAECISINEQQRSEVSSRCDDSFLVSGHQSIAVSASSQISLPPEKHSYFDNHSESISSAISSIEISSKLDESAVQLNSSRNRHSNYNSIMSCSSSLVVQGSTTASYVHKLIDWLSTSDPRIQVDAALELRALSKHKDENRVLIANCGAIIPLISLLYSDAKKVQESAVTALLNLSINDGNKVSIVDAGVIEPLILVLESGSTEAQENSAATLFSISILEEYKVQIGRSGAIRALVDLLGRGSLRGKKDAAAALFNLSIFHENKARIVQGGAVKHLVELMDPSTGMVNKSVALLANLSTVPEGRLAIAEEGAIPLLVEIVETGSQRGKENAASALFQLCINSYKLCNLVLQEGAVPPLIALSQFGSPRAKEKIELDCLGVDSELVLDLPFYFCLVVHNKSLVISEVSVMGLFASQNPDIIHFYSFLLMLLNFQS